MFGSPDDLALVRGLFAEDNDGFYVGEVGGEVVASVIKMPVAEGIYYSSYMFVHEKHR